MNKEFEYIKPTKKQYINATATWFKSMSESWIPFATTVVFKSSGHKPRSEYWINEYEHKFLWKVNKQLSRHASELLFYSDFCRYEFGESSRYKSLSDQRCPHHVHGIINIPPQYVHKIWNQDLKKIPERLMKDIKSIKNISSVLVEPIRLDEIENWIGYMVKDKNFYQE